MSKRVEEVLLQKIVYIGNTIPMGLWGDSRPKFIVLGTPQEFIDEVNGKPKKVTKEKKKQP